MKIHVDALHSFKVMLWTKKGRTDGWTDGQVDYYMPPFGGIKRMMKIESSAFINMYYIQSKL